MYKIQAFSCLIAPYFASALAIKAIVVINVDVNAIKV